MEPGSIAALVRQTRMQAGITIVAVAVEARTHMTMVCDIEHGRKAATGRVLRALERLAGLEIGTISQHAVDRELMEFLKGEPEIVRQIQIKMAEGTTR